MGKVSTSYKPGQSGNLKGAPKKEWTWAGIIEEEADKIDETDPEKKQRMKNKVVRAIMKKASEGDVPAFKEIANRTDGMPKETKDVNITLPKPIMDITDGVLQDNSNEEDSEIDKEG